MSEGSIKILPGLVAVEASRFALLHFRQVAGISGVETEVSPADGRGKGRMDDGGDRANSPGTQGPGLLRAPMVTSRIQQPAPFLLQYQRVYISDIPSTQFGVQVRGKLAVSLNCFRAAMSFGVIRQPDGYQGTQSARALV